MELVRKEHNLIKRSLIENHVHLGSSVLDVGCGAGGDLHKWKSVNVKSLDMCDPWMPLEEAKSRANVLGMHVTFHQCDVREAPKKTYDVIAYNFSIHYIFESRKTFVDSLHAIRVRLRIGGKLIGVVPDSDAVMMDVPFQVRGF